MNEYDNLLQGEPAPSGNEYDEILRNRNSGVRTFLNTAGKINIDPDKAADVIKIADENGLPRDTVERKLPELKGGNGPNEYDAFLASPVVARFLSDPYNQASIKDDESFTIIDKLLNGVARSYLNMKASTSAIRMSAAQQRLGRFAYIDAAVAAGKPLSPPDEAFFKAHTKEQWEASKAGLRAGRAESAESIEINSKVAQAVPHADPAVLAALGAGSASEFWHHFSKKPVEFIATVGAESALPSLAIAAAGFASGGSVPVAVTSSGAISFGTEYGFSLTDGLRNAGVDLNDRAAIENAIQDKKIMSDVAQHAFKRAGPIAALDALAGGLTGIGSRTLRGAAGSVAAQGVLGGTGEALAQLNSGEELRFGEIAAEFFGEFVTAPIEVGGMAAGRMVELRAQHMQAKENQAFFTALGATAEASKLRERLPDAMQKLVDDITQDGPVNSVYMDPKAFTEYFQSQDIDPKKVASELLGDANALDDAIASGQDLQIPLGAYTTKLAGTKHNAVLSRDLKFNPEDLSVRESEELIKAESEAAEAASTEQEAETVKDNVSKALQEAGYESSTADALATQMGAFFDTMAERSGGKSGLELFKQYALRILGRKDIDGRNRAPVRSFNQPAFHASPHFFDRFSLKNISGGEGGQVHGWGLYFGRSKSVINSKYKNRLAKPKIIGLSDNIVQDSQAFNLLSDPDFLLPIFNERTRQSRLGLLDTKLSDLSSSTRNFRARLSELQKLGDNAGAAALQSKLSQYELALGELQKLKESGDIKVEPVSRLYEVEIIADDTQLLDLDKQLPDTTKPPTRDNKLIHDFLTNPAVKGVLDSVSFNKPNPTGRDLYRALTRAARDGALPNQAETSIDQSPEEAASRYLLSHGILGLSYDGRSDGPSMVIFDESIIDITSYEQSSNDEKPRGKLIKYGDFEYDIALLEDANLSTFLHESGHLYLEIMKNLAKDNGSIKADLDVLLKWMGLESVDQIQNEHHEQFARATEAYFGEGKAPSPELRSVFAKFRAWLMSIYAKLTNLNVRLNDDVRGVMDRMFATDEQISAARNENKLEQVFLTAEQAGMEPAQFERYLKTIQDANRKATEELQTELMQEFAREQKDWWQSELDKVYSELAAERVKSNDVTAYHALRFGQDVNGQELPDSYQLKLDRDSLYTMYGKDSNLIEELRSLNTYRVKGGVHPDIAAEVFGFRSGDELVQSVIKARNYRAELATEANKIMEQRHGNMLKDGTIADKAIDAVMNDKRSEILHSELRALVKKRNEVAPFVQAERNTQRTRTSYGLATIRGVPSLETVRRIVKVRIAALTVRAMSPGKFLVAARRASKAAVEASTKDNYSAAAIAKQQELFNLEMYRQARNALEEIGSIEKYARKLADVKSQRRLGMAGQDYRDQINSILNRFDFIPTPMTEEIKRARLADWITQKEREGVTVNLDPRIVNEAFKRPYKTLTYEELLGVRDSLKHIDHLSKLKNKLLKSKDKRDLQIIVDDLEATIRDNFKGEAPEKTGIRLPQKEPARFIDQFFASHRKLSSFLRQMDGFVDGGPMWSAIMAPINAASNNETMMTHQRGNELKEIFKPYESMQSASQLYKREHEPAINAPLSRMERIMAALNIGNEDNRAKLKDGYGWSDEQVDAIVAPLTEQDWQFVQKIWNFVDSFWSDIKAKEERVNGIAPERVDASPVQTKYGEFTGGYFPLMYDDRAAPGAHANRVKEAAQAMMRGATTHATTKRGHTKERVQSAGLPVRLDFGVVFEHVHRVIHDLAFHETLVDINKLLGNKQLQNAVYETHGDIVYKQLQGAIEDIAAGEVPAVNSFERSVNWLRKGTSIAAMGWNLMTAAIQPLGFSQSIVRVGAPWMFKAFSRIFRDASHLENSAKWVLEKSDMMRSRHMTMGREINEIRNSIKGHVSAGVLSDSYFYFIAKMQQIVDVPTWIASYEKAMHGGASTDQAIAIADQAVLDSQGGGQVKDLAQIQRGGPLMKLWTNFYNYFNTTFNLTAESAHRTNFRDPLSIGRLAVDLLLLYTVPAVIGFMMRSALRDGDLPDDLIEGLMQEQASYLFGTMVGFREFSSVIQGYYGYEGPAGTRFYSEMSKLMRQVAQGEVDEAMLKSLNRTAGILLHYPAGQVQRTVDGYVALSEGRTDSPTALIFGPPKEER